MKRTMLERIGVVIKYLREHVIAIGEIEYSTQTRLGSIIGKGRSTISNYELGEINMKLQDIIDIFYAYGYNIVLIVVPRIKKEDMAKKGKLKRYLACVEINKMLLEKDEEEVRKILQSLGYDINI